LRQDNVRFLIVGPSEQFDTHNARMRLLTEKIKQLVDDYALRKKTIFIGIVPIDDKIKLYAACDMV
jgi:glycosyltransferase involved in cell wall biosynthesis